MGFGWELRNLTYEAFTNALFETYRNLANYGITVLNLATVDVPGVIIYHSQWILLWDSYILIDVINHIFYIHLAKNILISAWALTLSVQL